MNIKKEALAFANRFNAIQLAKMDRIARPIMGVLPDKILSPEKMCEFYSDARLLFLSKLSESIPEEAYVPDAKWKRKLWGIDFNSPLWNAAGMFKNGESYLVVAMQGAGAYLGGTGTWNERAGNSKEGIHLPVMFYTFSHSSSNWMGLPNDGDEINSERASKIMKIPGCPIGWSVMGSPDYEGEKKLEHLIKSMKVYDAAGVDFLEINESCPNTKEGKPQESGLAHRLKYVSENFLKQRERNIPVIVKFSNDTDISQVPYLLDMLLELGFDGVNFGNTSTDYAKRRKDINWLDRGKYDYFTKTFGGGVSGKPLKESSLELSASAVWHLGDNSREFHIIRTGGIDSREDINDSECVGISANQWFTGYMEQFAKCDHKLYRNIFDEKKS